MTEPEPIVFNPKDLPVENLPTLYAFAIGESYDSTYGNTVGPDGELLQTWTSSNESWLRNDLGCIPGVKDRLHKEVYQKAFPDGYRLEFVSREQWKAKANKKFMEFLDKNNYA